MDVNRDRRTHTLDLTEISEGTTHIATVQGFKWFVKYSDGVYWILPSNQYGTGYHFCSLFLGNDGIAVPVETAKSANERTGTVMQCPFCNAEIQATQVVHVYWSLVDGKWVDKGKETTEVRYYCKNDHTVRLTDKHGRPAHFPGIPQEMLN